jgi:serine/threonine-protein kinase
MTADPAAPESDAVLAELLDQMFESLRRGEAVDVDGVAEGHPELAGELRQLWVTALAADLLASVADEAADVAGSDRVPGIEENAAAGASTPDSMRTSGDVTPSASRGGGSPLPRTFGDFVLLEELGRGGMGIVYRAWQRRLERDVAVKMILRGELATSADLARFQAEAAAVARLSHPNIVTIYEVGELDEQPYFSMQLIDGETLAHRLTDGPLPAAEAAALLVPVCRAIGHAHRQGVLHRDLKPSNVIIDRSGQPYVTDFGLAKRVARPAYQAGLAGSGLGEGGLLSGTGLTESGAILGTPAYMAPEQAVGFRGAVAASADVYSLGAMLYATLTGRPPFQAASPVDVVLMVLEQDPLPPRVLNPKVPPDLEMIALKALQKPADLRYASADALADDLEAYLTGEPISARSSQFSQILSRAFRPTHHVGIMQNWGLLWMWHALVLFTLCLITNWMQWQGVTSRWPYLAWWTLGLGTWAVIFWNLRRRSGPVTFVERQIAHAWAASMACSTLLYLVEALLHLPVLTLSPVLALLAAAVFVVKAGILSGEFYIPAVLLFATCIPMALNPPWGLTIFGVVSGLCFAIPGWKFHRQRHAGL